MESRGAHLPAVDASIFQTVRICLLDQLLARYDPELGVFEQFHLDVVKRFSPALREVKRVVIASRLELPFLEHG